MLFLAGWAPILERWGQLRPAHAWTNVIGFVSLVIVATLLHFLPTVLGGRIVPRRSAALAVLGIAMGTPVVVLGMLAGLGAGRRRGSGAGGGRGAGDGPRGGAGRARARPLDVRSRLAPVRVRRPAGRGGLVRRRRLARGRTPRPVRRHGGGVVDGPRRGAARRRLDRAGAVGLVDPPAAVDRPRHARCSTRRQRAILGRLATPRLLALNGGVALLAIGWPIGLAVPTAAGGVLVAVAVMVSVTLAVEALRAGR